MFPFRSGSGNSRIPDALVFYFSYSYFSWQLCELLLQYTKD
jgi:hypothetical protein